MVQSPAEFTHATIQDLHSLFIAGVLAVVYIGVMMWLSHGKKGH